MWLQCIKCNSEYDLNEIIYNCKKCGDLLSVMYDWNSIISRSDDRRWRDIPLSVWKYHNFLPQIKESRRITLNEGGTTLYNCKRTGKLFGTKHLYVKNEGENPTGSFKDRGMTVAISKAVQLNMTRVVCASTGNTSSSLSAYAARAGLDATVITPSGETSLGKMVQSVIHGANIVHIDGGFDVALELVLNLIEKHSDVYLLNSINPFRVEGQKTISFEICDQLKHSPEVVVVPVGNAGNITSLWKGFLEFQKLGFIEHLPRMIGVQAEGAAPIAEAFHNDKNNIKPVTRPKTVASAIRIGSPVNWKRALMAVRESEGDLVTVSDHEILYAQNVLSKYEGIFVEPASATSVAAVKKLIDKGQLTGDEEIICITTGHGLKDPEVVSNSTVPEKSIPTNLSSLENALNL